MPIYCNNCQYQKIQKPVFPFSQADMNNPDILKLRSEWDRELRSREQIEEQNIKKILFHLKNMKRSDKQIFSNPKNLVLWFESEPWFHDICERWTELLQSKKRKLADGTSHEVYALCGIHNRRLNCQEYSAK